MCNYTYLIWAVLSNFKKSKFISIQRVSVFFFFFFFFVCCVCLFLFFFCFVFFCFVLFCFVLFCFFVFLFFCFFVLFCFFFLLTAQICHPFHVLWTTTHKRLVFINKSFLERIRKIEQKSVTVY